MVQRADAFAVIERDFAAPRPAVWEHVTLPAHHLRWQRSDGVVEKAVKGRRGAGTQNHCQHGKDAIIEDILDWRPFDYVTQTALLPIPGAAKILMTYAFDERDDGGTHFELRVAKPKPKDLPFLEQVWPAVQQNYDIGLEFCDRCWKNGRRLRPPWTNHPCQFRANASSPTLFTLTRKSSVRSSRIDFAIGIISAGAEIIFAFGWFEDIGACVEGGQEACDGSLGDFPQEGLHFGVGLFDGVHIRAVGRQIPQFGSSRHWRDSSPRHCFSMRRTNRWWAR